MATKSPPQPTPAVEYTTDPALIPFRKVLYLPGGVVRYECPDDLWASHHKAWCKVHRTNDTAPQPMPARHLMFDDPTAWAAVPYGCADEAVLRAAWEAYVRGTLDGWNRDTPPEAYEKIVKTAVDVKMRGEDFGTAPFVLCLLASS